jgi:hypothetical protein
MVDSFKRHTCLLESKSDSSWSGVPYLGNSAVLAESIFSFSRSISLLIEDREPRGGPSIRTGQIFNLDRKRGDWETLSFSSKTSCPSLLLVEQGDDEPLIKLNYD